MKSPQRVEKRRIGHFHLDLGILIVGEVVAVTPGAT